MDRKIRLIDAVVLAVGLLVLWFMAPWMRVVGWVLSAAAARFLAEQGFSVVTLDISPMAIERAERLSSYVDGIRYIVGDSLVFRSDIRFDLVLD